MLPIVAIVGRPNVGKSTLFNALTRTRDGDRRRRARRHARSAIWLCPGSARPCVLIDTGGLLEHPQGLQAQIRRQTERAIAEADALIFVADARSGLTSQDEFIARELRRVPASRSCCALNKAEGLEPDLVAADFHRLGLGEPHAIAAAHGDGTRELLEEVLQRLPEEQDEAQSRRLSRGADDAIRVAIIGRPNVGKSTLVNRLIGEERVIASEQPGTTRDSILVPFERDGRRFLLVDTAGMRRRARVEDAIERASVGKTLQAIAEAHVVILVLDAHDAIGEQDASVLGLALERGRVLLIAVNKWDGIAPEQREQIRDSCSSNSTSCRLRRCTSSPRDTAPASAS